MTDVAKKRKWVHWVALIASAFITQGLSSLWIHSEAFNSRVEDALRSGTSHPSISVPFILIAYMACFAVVYFLTLRLLSLVNKDSKNSTESRTPSEPA